LGDDQIIAGIRPSCPLWQLGLMLAIVLSVSVTACGTQRAQSGQTPTRTRKALGDALPPAALSGRISPLLPANFALLHAPPDGIPLAARQVLGGSVPGIRWNLARRIPVSLSGKYWLVPGADNICVVAKTPGSLSVDAVCASVTQALHHGVASTSLNPTSGRRVIVGVVPTGTRTVLVRSGAAISSARAFHGHFSLHDSVAAPPDELTLR
jgi:hypothetical protein